MALATLEEFEVRNGAQSNPDKVEAFLEDASALVIEEAGTDWSGEGEQVPAAVVVVVLTATARALRNPDGAESERVGQYSVTHQRQLGGVWLTRAEIRICRRAGGAGGIGSIEIESPYDLGTVETIPVDDHGDLRGDELPWVTLGGTESAY